MSRGGTPPRPEVVGRCANADQTRLLGLGAHMLPIHVKRAPILLSFDAASRRSARALPAQRPFWPAHPLRDARLDK
jgi:hypothetical protein